MQIEAGDRVCIVGQGSDNMVHVHSIVERVTKTMIVTKHRRFRRESTGHSVPYSPYGGTRVAAFCQREKS